MAEPLSPSISQGINRGEAAFLGDSSFDPIRFTEGVVRQEQQRRIGEKREREQEYKSLLDDDFKAKWDIDAIKAFQPRIESFRNNVISAFKESKGRLTPEQKIMFESEKKRIQEDVLLSNTVYDAYVRNVNRLSQNPKGLDIESSRRNLEVFKDPMSDPNTAKEVQELYGGDIVRWRADNALKYGLVDELDRNVEFGNIAKTIKPSTNFVRDEKGDVKQTYNPQTGSYEKQMITEINPQDFESKITEIYTTDNYKNKKLREADEAFVEQVFSFDPQTGDVLYDQNDPLAVSVFQGAAQTIKGMTDPAKIKKELAKEKTRQYLESFLPEASVKQLRDRRPQARTSGGGGGGKSWDDRFNLATGDLPKDQIRTQLKTIGFEDDKFIPSYIDTYRVPKGGKYVSILKTTPSKADEIQPQTTLKNREIKVIGFVVNPDGSVTMDFSYQDKIDMGRKGQKVQDLVERNYDIAKDVETLTSVAASYGFNKAEDFLEFIKKRSGVKFEPPKTRTEAKKGKTNTPPKKDWSKYKRN